MAKRKQKKSQLQKNKKSRIKKELIAFGVIAVTAIIQIFIHFWIETVYNWAHGVVYEDGVMTPIFAMKDMENSTLIQAQKYAESYGGKVLEGGGVLNVFIHNQKKEQVPISETSLVIDDIEEIRKPRVFVILDYVTNSDAFELYLINNDLAEVKGGTVSISGKYLEKEGQYQKKLGIEESFDLWGKEMSIP